jgi:CBS domain containing-hemolysin-like protein
MAVCAVGSAFFSLSEAALFALDQRTREELAQRGRRGKRVSFLLSRGEDLLAVILLGNLLVNLAYFTFSAIVSFSLQRQRETAAATASGVVSLLVLIVFCEMLPKTLGVSYPRFWSQLVATPLMVIFRALEWLLPPLRGLSRLSLRLVWPGFRAEPYLQVGDLERAVEWSIVNRLLLCEEEAVLQSLVALADVRADELMRPRRHLPMVRPPVRWSDLSEQLLRRGGFHVFICDPATDDPISVLNVARLYRRLEEPLERWAEPLLPVPWCISAADVLQQLRDQSSSAAAVLNEYGETIGVLTFDDLVRAALSLGTGAPGRPLQREPIRYLGSNRWQVTGTTALRRLAKHVGIPLPPSRCVSVGGLLQESLGRFPKVGDECRCGQLHYRVVDVSDDGDILVELRVESVEEARQQ